MISRSLFNHSFTFAEELSEILILLVTFIGLSYAAGQGRHIRMSALLDLLPPKWQKPLVLFIHFATAGLMLLLFVYAINYVRDVHALGSRSPVLGIPYFIIYSVAPLGFLLTSLKYLWLFFINLRSDVVVFSHLNQDGGESPPSAPI